MLFVQERLWIMFYISSFSHSRYTEDKISLPLERTKQYLPISFFLPFWLQGTCFHKAAIFPESHDMISGSWTMILLQLIPTNQNQRGLVISVKH